MTDESRAHLEKLDRLWRAIKRDYFANVWTFAGLGRHVDSANDAPWRRINANWRELYDLDPDLAGRLWHGFNEMAMVFGATGAQAHYHDRVGAELKEAFGLIDIAREANPDLTITTLGEGVAAGEEVLRAEIERETEQ